jgi:hypothetical protein
VLFDLAVLGAFIGAYKLYDTVVPDGLPDWLIEAIKILRNDFNIELPFDIIRNWATTQQYNYYNQLARGIRFLDIRVVWDGTTFRTAHMIVGDPIEDLIDQVEQFLIESEEVRVFPPTNSRTNSI